MFKKIFYTLLCIVIFNQNFLIGQVLPNAHVNTETLDFECVGSKIKFYNSDIEEPNYLIPANWNFFHSIGVTPFQEEGDFTDNLPERFFVEIKSSGEGESEIFGTLESYDMTGELVDEIINFRLGQAGDSNFFGSKDIILVSDIDKLDDNFDNENCPVEIPGDYDYDDDDDTGTDRTLACKAGGTIRASYQNVVKEINICGGEEQGLKTVNLNIFVTTKEVDGEIVPVIEEEDVIKQIEFVKNRYVQCCINFSYQTQPLPIPTDVDVNLSDGLTISNLNIETEEMMNIINLVKEDENNNDIRLYE